MCPVESNEQMGCTYENARFICYLPMSGRLSTDVRSIGHTSIIHRYIPVDYRPMYGRISTDDRPMSGPKKMTTDALRCKGHRPIICRISVGPCPMCSGSVSDAKNRWRHRKIITPRYNVPITSPMPKKASDIAQFPLMPGRLSADFAKKIHRKYIVT